MITLQLMQTTMSRLAIVCLLGVATPHALNYRLAAEEPPADAASPMATTGTRRALVVCGLPGDAAHRKTFAETVELLFQGLTKNHEFLPENVHVLWGDEATDKDG